MLQDLQYAVRVLLRSKAWTLVVVLSLAIGIGANAAIFSAFNGLMLRTLPVDHPDSLVRFQWVSAGADDNPLTDHNEYGYSEKDGGLAVSATFPYAIVEQFRRANHTLVDLFACAPEGQMNVVANGRGELASGLVASGSYFESLGVRAIVGRTFTPDDDRPGATPVAVLSHGYWVRRFGGDLKVIGTVLHVNNVPVTVIGVTPPSFTGVQQVLTEARDITMPLALDPQFNFDSTPDRTRLSQPTWWWLQIMGRVRPGITPAQVRGDLEGVFQAAAKDGWAAYLGSLSERERSLARNQSRVQVPRLRVASGSRGIYDVDPDTYRAMTLLGIVVALVLLIVCANVANLLLSRAAARQREIAVRLSLGATRGRLIRQLLTESAVLASIGAALGMLVAYWGRQLLPSNLALATPLDWRVLGFVGGLTLAAGLAFGVAPAWRATDAISGSALKDGQRAVAGGRSPLARSLVVAQVAISLVLLVGAGLFLRTVRNLRSVDVGFDTHNLLLVPVNAGLNRYDQTRIAGLFGEMLDRLPQVPGVRMATLSTPALLAGSLSRTQLFIQGRSGPREQNRINRMTVAPNFFATMGIPLVAGRGLTARDGRTAPNVVVINEAAARKYFPHESPLGRRVGSTFETSGDREVVGVVRDVKYNSVRDAMPPTMYLPHLQAARLDVVVTFELRTIADPVAVVPAVRDAIRRIDPTLPVLAVSTQTDQIERRFAQEKIFAQAYALFGGLALTLASIGLFGLMSYSVARRTNEIGIRMALGAQRAQVVAMVMGESMILVAVGVAIGAGVAFGAGRLVASLLFGLASTDPMTMTVAVLLMVVVSALAGYLPARAAARVDPLVALRYE